jgi:hypothetical protein
MVQLRTVAGRLIVFLNKNGEMGERQPRAAIIFIIHHSKLIIHQ